MCAIGPVKWVGHRDKNGIVMRVQYLQRFLGEIAIAVFLAGCQFPENRMPSNRLEYDLSAPDPARMTWLRGLGVEGPLLFFSTPNPAGHTEFIQNITAAEKVIHMTMYHLTDKDDIEALIAAAHRGVEVRIILDGRSLEQSERAEAADVLREGGVKVQASAPGFSITHVKAMTIDGSLAIISSINLTTSHATTRDFGIATTDPHIVAEMESVFAVDWLNAERNEHATPELANPNLLWSPVNARDKLEDLIDSATMSLSVYVENLGDPVLHRAFARAAKRNVDVRILVPLCDKSTGSPYNVPFLRRLQAEGVHALVMVSPATPDRPYIHAKTILVDGTMAYLGSVNFSNNSTTKARELGIVLRDAQIMTQIGAIFEKDWSVAQDIPAVLPSHCPRQP